ncbi:MAG: class I SAM-dependent methyltransferase [Bacteroidota bacterium]
MFRAYLLTILRYLGLSHALDQVRYAYARLRNRKKNRTFLKEYSNFPLPPDYLMYESFRLDYAAYHRSGREAAEWIKAHFATHTNDLAEKTILDWGCGPGRVLRHLPDVFGYQGHYIGMDPNEGSIAWCKAYLVDIDARLCKLTPPLPTADSSIDFLYGISIFTHLSENAHRAWIEEIYRVLRPSGLALLTTHGPAYKVKLTPNEKTSYDNGALVVRGKVQEGHRIFTTYQPPDYFKDLVQEGGEVLKYVAGRERKWGIEQDTWVIRKT